MGRPPGCAPKTTGPASVVPYPICTPAPGERAAKACDELRGDRGGAHADAPHRREIGGREAFGLPADEGEHRGDRGDQGAPVPRDGVDVGSRFEARQQHDDRPRREGELGEGEGVHVVEGSRHEDPFGPVVDRGLPPLLDHPPVPAMGERHPLGQAARARGVEDHRGLAGLGRHGGQVARGRKPAYLVEGQTVDPRGEVVLVRVAEREPGARVPQHVLDGRAGKPDVDGHRDEAGLHDAEDRDQVLRAVGGEHGHPVAAPEAAGEEEGRRRSRLLVDAASAPLGTARPTVDDEDPLPIEGEVDEVAQVPAFVRLRGKGPLRSPPAKRRR